MGMRGYLRERLGKALRAVLLDLDLMLRERKRVRRARLLLCPLARRRPRSILRPVCRLRCCERRCRHRLAPVRLYLRLRQRPSSRARQQGLSRHMVYIIENIGESDEEPKLPHQ